MASISEAPIVSQMRVLHALILRDVHTHYGASFLGYFVVILKPLSRLLILMAMYLFIRGRVAAIGTNPALFFATGALPYILFVHPALSIMSAIATNRPLLYFPIVHVLDVIFARGIVEIITAFWVTAIFCVILLLCGVDIVPLYIHDAIQAILATIYLGFAMGCFAAVMNKLMATWAIFFALFMTVLYFTSGIFFIPSSMPVEIQNIVWWNPLMHAVEWLRSAYYEGYGYGLLDRGYLLSFSTITLFLTLVLERATRGRLLQL